MDSIRIGRGNGNGLIEPAPNHPVYCDGISVVGRTGDIIHLAAWVEQPCLHPGVTAMERVVLHRFAMTYNAFMRSRIDNHEIVTASDGSSCGAH